MRSLLAGLLVVVMLSACSSTGSKRKNINGEEKNPAEVNTQLGIQYMRNGMYEAALEKLNKAAAHDPNLQLTQVSLAILYERLGEVSDARKHYQRAYNINRKDPVTLNAYGQFLCTQGELEKADGMFVAAAKDPLYQYPELIYTNAGICALKRPDMELADTYFRKALQRNPRYSPALREMSRTTFAQQQFLATRAYLQRLQEVATLTPEFLWIGVQTEHALNDANAMSSYALVLKNQYPESDEARELLRWERKPGER
jgi:type IV pilus assembly protein PilF